MPAVEKQNGAGMPITKVDELAKDATATAFYAEMKRFLPSARVAHMSQMNLQRTMLSDSVDLIRKTVV